ncbi:MAG: hypothetical protein A2014_01180 [Spirochaetes bacterium GWF1_49_6]|nr:MAG: hypothetical protein A2014_01180 [Spirochaetes bacterium GWF1_49_6]
MKERKEKLLWERSHYYQFLKTELGSGECTEKDVLCHLPDFYMLLADLLNMIRLDREDRAYVCAALGYLVAPADWIPELIHGPDGYIDDLFVTVYVIDRLAAKYGIGPIKSLWEGEGDFEAIYPRCLEYSHEKVEKLGLTDKVLKYVGLL